MEGGKNRAKILVGKKSGKGKNTSQVFSGLGATAIISANLRMEEDAGMIDEGRNAEELKSDENVEDLTEGNPTNLTVDSSILDSSLAEPRRIRKLDATVVNRIAAGKGTRI